MTATLALYDSARRALAEALAVDQVLAVRTQSEQLKLYARLSKDHELKANAMELQLRAERRLGELLLEARAQGLISKGGRPRSSSAPEGAVTVATLKEAGIDHRLSSNAQKLARIEMTAFEAVIRRAREKIVAGAAVVVNPVKDVTAAEKRLKRQIREVQMAARQRALPQTRYGVIYADPEWPFATWSEAGKDRSAENHYPTSLVPVIAARPVAEIAAADCALFLWVTRPLLPAGLQVMEAWGFAYKTCWDWDKIDVGTGYWCRDRSEILLLGTRGDIPAPAPGTQYPSLIAERRREHSRKPEWAYEMIEAYFPHLPKIELNARLRRAGWAAWGLEAPDENGAADEAA